MLKEFRDFAIRGNAVDLAVGLVIGAAFGAVVSSLVSDIMMPPIGKLLGGVDFSDLFIPLGGGPFPSLKAAQAAGAATINYGVFLNRMINFIIVSLALFMVVKAMNRLRPAPAPAPATKDCPRCTTAIPAKATRCPLCTSDLH